MLLEKSNVLAGIFSIEKSESFDSYVTIPRSIFSFGKCEAWFSVHKVPFTSQGHVREQKQTKHAFSWLKKMNLLTDKQLFIIVHFQSTKSRKEEFCVVNKVQEAIGNVYCPRCRNEKSLQVFQQLKRLVSTTVRSTKPAATF